MSQDHHFLSRLDRVSASHPGLAALMLFVTIACGCERTLPAESKDAGIGPPADPSSVDYVSGSRLRARVYISDSGARVRHTWFDLRTQQECAFRRATDGLLRCLPLDVPPLVFADPQCSRRAMLLRWLWDLPRVVSVGTCTASVHAAGPPREASAAFVLADSGCIPYPFGVEGLSVLELGPELSPQDFVAAESVLEPRGESIALRYLQAEDGARQPWILFDPHRDTSCSVSSSVPSSGIRCLPVPAAARNSRLFADSACSEPAWISNPCRPLDGEAPFGLVFPEDPCAHTGPLSAVPLAPATTTQQYELDAGQCVAAAPTDAGLFVAAGNPIGIDELPRAGHEHGPGDGVVLQWIVSAEGHRLKADGLFDTRAGSRCTVMRATDCSLRCFPNLPSGMSGWIDAACKRPVAVTLTTSCQEDPPELMITSQHYSPCRDSVVRVLRTGASLPEPEQLFTGSDCVGQTVGAKLRYFEATEIPPSEFPEIIEATE